jgi:hypothetical protein
MEGTHEKFFKMVQNKLHFPNRKAGIFLMFFAGFMARWPDMC